MTGHRSLTGDHTGVCETNVRPRICRQIRKQMKFSKNEYVSNVFLDFQNFRLFSMFVEFVWGGRFFANTGMAYGLIIINALRGSLKYN